MFEAHAAKTVVDVDVLNVVVDVLVVSVTDMLVLMWR